MNLIDPTGLSCEDTGEDRSQGETNREGAIILGTYCDQQNPEYDGPPIAVNDGTTTGPIASAVAAAAQDGEESRDEGEMSENSNDQTDGWQCFKDVSWGAFETTVIGTLTVGIAEAMTHPERRFSGDNANGRRLRRGNYGTARAIARGVDKAGLIGIVIRGDLGGIISYAESEHCPAIF